MPPSWRWNLAEDQAPGGHRQPAGDPPAALERGCTAPPVDLPQQGRPEDLEDLWDQDHRGGPMVADRLENDPRVARSDVQDVGPEVQRQIEPDGLLEEMGQREDGHDAVVHLRDNAMETIHARDRVLVGQHHALWGAGRAGGEDQQVRVFGSRAGPGSNAGVPIGREPGTGLGAEIVDRDRRQSVQVGFRGVRGVASRADGQLAGLGPIRDPSDRGGRHAQVQWHDDHACAHCPEVDGGQLRAGG